MMPRADVVALKMSVDEALKYVISMGVVAPPMAAGRRPKLTAAGRARLPCGTALRAGPTATITIPDTPNSAGAIHENHLLRPRQRSADGPDRDPDGLGPSPPRPWRRDLHRPARPRGPGAGRLRPRPRRDVRHRRGRAQRVLPAGDRQGARAPGRHRERQPHERQDRGAVPRARGAEPQRHAAVPARRRQPVGDHAADAPRARPAPPGDAEEPDAALPRRDGGAQVPRRAGLHRHRDADADQEHARGRARLPGAQPRARRPRSSRCRRARSCSSSC